MRSYTSGRRARKAPPGKAPAGGPGPIRGRRAWALVVGIAVLGTLAAACSGTGSAATVSSTASKEQALLNFAKCMRSNGVNIPDPTLDANGNVRFSRPQTAAGATPAPDQRQKFETARTACQKYLKGITLGFSQADRTKLQDTLVKYAQCMRAHGVNMPDPNLSNFRPGATPPSPGSGGPFGNIDRNSPAFQKANQACRSIFASAGLPGGFGGPRGGAGP
jgi:hypothetical protein